MLVKCDFRRLWLKSERITPDWNGLLPFLD